MDIGAADRDERAGNATVPVTVDGGRVASYAYYAIRALRAAAQTRFTVMGWGDEPWATATEKTQRLEDMLLHIAAFETEKDLRQTG